MFRVRTALAMLAFVGFLSSGCDTTRTVAPLEVAPVANSAAGAVQRLGWAFNHRDVEMLRGLLSAEFVFQSAAQDSAGNPAPDTTLIRNSLSAILRSLLAGGPGVPAPASARLSLGRNLLPFPDTRAGKNSTWHKTIRTSVDLVVVDSSSQQTFETTGHGLFYLVRGDSVAIPAELKGRGSKPDSTRWWIDRWDDETIGNAGHTRTQLR